MQDNNTHAANEAANRQLQSMQGLVQKRRPGGGRHKIGNTRLGRITLPDVLTASIDRWIKASGGYMTREKAVIELVRIGLTDCRRPRTLV